MKSLALLVLVSSHALALTAAWNPDPFAEGFKLYWREVERESDCEESSEIDFKHSVNVGDKTRYRLSDSTFQFGKIYEIL